MGQDCKKEVEEIIGHLKCPKDFKCCQSGFETLCRARQMDDGVGSYLECLEEDPEKCAFANYISTGVFHLCSCPLRRYVADRMAKGQLHLDPTPVGDL
jgi:hypothetical protein